MTDSIFGPEYCKINTAFKRNERGVIIPGDWTLDEFIYLQDNDWTWTEKVDGTNIRLHWDGEKAVIGGRTDNAQIPASLITALEPYVDADKWKAVFPDADDVTVYGEGYGAGIQKGGGTYRKDKGLILFDVKVGRWWLKREDAEGIAESLGLHTVPAIGNASLSQAWKWIQDGSLESAWPGVAIEGIVGIPLVDLARRNGDRLIVKLKVKDWQDYQRKQEKE